MTICKFCGSPDVVSDPPCCEVCLELHLEWYVDQLNEHVVEWVSENPPPKRICACGNLLPSIYFEAMLSQAKECDDCYSARMIAMNATYLRIANSRPKSTKITGHVYFASNGGTRTKIGKSLKLGKRLEVLGVDLIHSLEIADYTKVERFFHERFAPYRVIGEWFELPDTVLGWVKGLATDGEKITDADNVIVWSDPNA